MDPLHEDVSTSVVGERKVHLWYRDTGVFGDINHCLRFDNVKARAMLDTDIFGQHQHTASLLAEALYESCA